MIVSATMLLASNRRIIDAAPADVVNGWGDDAVAAPCQGW